MKNRIYTTASVVTALSVAERGLGFLYRIVLSRFIGAEGVGLYQVALSLFSLFLTIGTGGLPVSVSRMISKSKAENNPRGERRAISSGLLLSLLLTLPLCIVLGVFGKRMTFLFSDDRCLSVFRILLIGLVFTSLYAVIRGYFWGNKKFLLSSVLEISEETVMVIVGVLLLKNVSSAQIGAEKAAWAAVVSYLFSFTAAVLCFLFQGGRLSSPKQALKPLFNATLPITSVRASGSFVNSAVAVLLPAMLIRSGINETEALKLFGAASGMALPILFIPATIIGSISLVLVPELSEDFYRKNFERLNKNLQRGLRYSLLVSCILIPFFYALGKDVGQIAFSNVLAGEIIVKSCPILLHMSFNMISTGMLNSMGFEKKTFLFYFYGAAAMLLCVLCLPPVCGVYAYMIGLGANFSINAVCNLLFLHKKCSFLQKGRGQVRVHSIFLPLLFILPVSIVGQFCSVLFKRFLGELLAVFLSACVMGLFTIVLYLLTKQISFHDFPKLFKSRKNDESRT